MHRSYECALTHMNHDSFIYEGVMDHLTGVMAHTRIFMRVMAHMNESWFMCVMAHTYEGVIVHMCRGTYDRAIFLS